MGDMSIHIKTKILKWDVKMVAQLHTKGETKIAQQLLEDGQKFMNLNKNEDQKSENMTEKKAIPSEYKLSTGRRSQNNEDDVNESEGLAKIEEEPLEQFLEENEDDAKKKQ